MREKEDDKEKRRLAGCTHSSHVGQAGRHLSANSCSTRAFLWAAGMVFAALL